MLSKKSNYNLYKLSLAPSVIVRHRSLCFPSDFLENRELFKLTWNFYVLIAYLPTFRVYTIDKWLTVIFNEGFRNIWNPDEEQQQVAIEFGKKLLGANGKNGYARSRFRKSISK